jgi:hypothetical protein
MYTAKAWRKQRKASVASAVDVDSLLAPTPTAEEYVPAAMNDDVAPADDEITRRPQVSGEVLVVELDETHVIATSSVN